MSDETLHRITDLDRKQLSILAATSLSTTPRPFLKWAGSKRRFLPDILPHLPHRFNRYYEPFLGSGALFFLLRPTSAILSDNCAELIQTYEAVRTNPVAVSRYLAPLRPDRRLFYSIRDNRSRCPYERAAEFIYLNKTCWNGLYRVNQNGQFNVPYGRPRSNHIASETNIHSCANALAFPGIRLAVGDFQSVLGDVGTGDLVFLDPPYVTGHRSNGFVDYNEKLFSWSDQERLAKVAKHLRACGAHVLITNADHPSVRQLYKGFQLHFLTSHSTISGKTCGRRKMSQLLVVG